MKHLLIVAFLVGLQLPVFAQIDSTVNLNEPFIYMFNGKLIPAEKVIYNSKILGKDFINVDDQRYEINDVKFYQGLDGFYANSKKYQVGNFLKRKEEGNANIYWFSGSVSSTTSGPGGYHPPGTGYTITQTSTKTTFFYNIGF